MGVACVGGVSPARGPVQRGDAAGGESSRVEVISQTLAAANLDFINLVEVVDESAATAVLERLNALVALSAFLGGEGIGEPGRGGERDGAESCTHYKGMFFIMSPKKSKTAPCYIRPQLPCRLAISSQIKLEQPNLLLSGQFKWEKLHNDNDRGNFKYKWLISL